MSDDIGPNTNYIIAWIDRMCERFGGTVWDGATTWDWGQALCRELYGPEWVHSMEHQAEDRQGDLNYSTVVRAQEWEAGDWPDWACVEKNCPHCEQG